MKLNLYLKQRNVISGPLARTKNTSHSALDVILKHLTNRPQFKGGETFLVLGNALHGKFLVAADISAYSLSVADFNRISAMCKKLGAHVVVKQLMQGAVCEVKKKRKLNGVLVAYILDINQKHKKRGADLKTTTCKTLEEFIEKAIEYGYFRQGETYKIAEGLKDFVFVGIQKEPPHNVYILDVSLYPDEIKYAQQELEFLLYFYSNYGIILKSGIDLRSNLSAAQAVIQQISSIATIITREAVTGTKQKVTAKFSNSKQKMLWQRKPAKK